MHGSDVRKMECVSKNRGQKTLMFRPADGFFEPSPFSSLRLPSSMSVCGMLMRSQRLAMRVQESVKLMKHDVHGESKKMPCQSLGVFRVDANARVCGVWGGLNARNTRFLTRRETRLRSRVSQLRLAVFVSACLSDELDLFLTWL